MGSSIFRSGAPVRCSPISANSVPTAGAVLWVFSAAASAHCSMNTKVSPVWCSEYSWQPGSSCTASMALMQAVRTASTDSGLAVNEATMTTGIGRAPI